MHTGAIGPPRRIGIFFVCFGPCKDWLEMAPIGARSFFPLLIQTSPTCWTTRISICIFFFIPYFQNSRFLDFQISDSWILEPGSWLWLAAAWGGDQSPDLGGFWTALPDHRIQEIQGTRQYCKNPISASLVSGIIRILLPLACFLSFLRPPFVPFLMIPRSSSLPLLPPNFIFFFSSSASFKILIFL